LIKIAYSPVYKYALPEGHRFPMSKYELLPQQLLYEGLVNEDNFFHPPQLIQEDILLTHTAAYIEKLESLNLTRKEIRDIGFPVTKALVERGKHIANGTFMCAEFAAIHGIALNIAGGTHHAFANRGEGFCVFNDFAIAINIFFQRNIYNKVLIIDLDVHQGNGNAKIFEGDPRVFTFSMHGQRNYPLRKEKSDLDIGLADNTNDQDYLDVLKHNLTNIIKNFKPQFVFYLAGVDVLESDKLGRLSMTRQGCKERDRIVLQHCKDNDIPIAVSMGGGYSERLSDIIEAHANTFRIAFELFE